VFTADRRPTRPISTCRQIAAPAKTGYRASTTAGRSLTTPIRSSLHVPRAAGQHPNTGNALGSTTSYTNPDGTTTTTPTVAPNGISLTSYNSGQVNPLSIFAVAANAQTRTAYVSIQKPAYYWLTLAALGTSDAFGGQIDDVKITALTSPYYATYASSAVTIPVPSPQPSSDVTYTGFTSLPMC